MMRFFNLKKISLLVILLFCSFLPAALAQSKTIRGTIKDKHSDEPLPFVSVRFQKSGIGLLSDSSGAFVLTLSHLAADTLEVTTVGYQDYKVPVDPAQFRGDSLRLHISLERGKIITGVVVRAKGNRALWFWRKIVQHKKDNDRYRFANFSYELYNKLELDLKNINRDKLEDRRLLRPFNFILDNIDTTEGAPFLPAYLTEALSDYYYQKSPLKRREVFKAVKTIGVNNASASRLLGGMDQNVNFYNNYIAVFDKQFVSPISDHGDDYYNYKLADTQYVAGRRLVHFLFTPRRKGTNTFEGDCWVHDSTFAIQKMTLRLSKEANINYVNMLSLIQEYQLLGDSTWFLSKDKFVVDVTPFGKSNLAFIGRKTTTYRNIRVNDPQVTAELAKNRILEETHLPDAAMNRPDSFWSGSRHEGLNRNEQGIYTMIDSMMKVPAFKTYTEAINFIGTGYMNLGNYQIGPWQNWIFSNSLEGTRLRFDLGTNHRFSDKFYFHGYGAYGFGDRKWKGQVDGMWLLQKHPRMYLYGQYLNDFDYGQNYYDEISTDNIFAMSIRKSGVPFKFIRLKEQRLDFFKEWDPGISVLLSSRRKQYDPMRHLPEKSYFQTKEGEAMNTFETSVRLRFAYLEKFLEGDFLRLSLGSPLPIAEVKYTRGISGVLNSSYDYHKLSGSVSDYIKVPPFGTLYVNIFGGKTFGTLPYTFLDIAPGNEIYYYNRYAFNMMNRYEYIHDRYAGFNVEHTFGNGIFRFTPLTRKLRFRQFWTAKGLWGTLNEENKALNYVGDYPFRSLDGKRYLELGTGVDNILKVLRVDFVWRVLPRSVPAANGASAGAAQRFGVFGSFRLAF
ncbi:DUF5686 family protein [Paraflavisolibacter sp. H34]|uniref:DUF5686 family protein n=1 Tax=Huijunlia imazamoxiresistens TaxID=3127457 RepID=UPI00301A8EDF